MKILHVTEVRTGGVLSLLNHYIPGQIAQGDEVHVLSNDDLPTWPGAHRHEWGLDRRRPSTWVTALARFRSVVAEVHPDVIHLHSFVAGLLGRLPYGLSGTEGSAVVYQPHAWSDALSDNKVFQLTIQALERHAALRTDLLAVNCEDEADRGREFGVHLPHHVVSIAVDLGKFRPASVQERAGARASLGVADDQRILLVLGRLVRQKGQDLLVAEWERHHPPRATLVLVGPGDPEPLAALAPTTWGDTILAPGPSSEVVRWLWAADALVVPSRYEGMAVVLAEAMAVGLPTVSTDISGARAGLVDGPWPRGGQVVTGLDMRALLDAATARLDDDLLWRQESEAGPVRAHGAFSPAHVLTRLSEAYDRARNSGRDRELRQA